MRHQQSASLDLRDMDRLRDESAAVLRTATTRAGKRYAPAFAPTSLSRARRGDVSNPIYRMDSLLVAMRRAGEPYDAAELLLAHFRGVAAELWQDALPAVETAVLHEQEADAHEDVAQVDALMHSDRMARHVAALERQIAASTVLVAVERRELARVRRSA